MFQHLLRTATLCAILTGLFLALAPARASAQIDVDNDPAYWLLRLANKRTRWPGPFPVRLEVSTNAVCQDELTLLDVTCLPNISAANVQALVNRGAAEWNTAIAGEELLEDEFFVGCNGGAGTCSLPTYLPYAVDPTMGDNAGNLLQDPPDNRTCVFAAYHVDENGDFDTYVSYPDCSVTPADCSGSQPTTFTPVASAGLATPLCTLYVEHTVNPGADRFQPVRDADGILQVTGDGRNRYFVEQFDFDAATAGLTGGNDAVLALTITRGLVFGNRSEITEADIVINAEFGGSAVDQWTDAGATEAPTDNCNEPGEHTDGTDDIDDSGDHLCYTGDVSFGTVPGPYTFDLENVTTHELGHFVGLDHPCARHNEDFTGSPCRAAAENPDPTTRISSTTMFALSNEGQTSKRTIEEPDVDGLIELFTMPFGAGGGGGGICEMARGGRSSWGILTAAVFLLPVLLLYGFGKRRRAPARPRGGRKSWVRPLAVLLALGVGLAWAGMAWATTLRIVSTASLVRSSQAIAQVRVTGSRTVVLGNGSILTLYQIEVDDPIAGAFPAEIAVPGGVAGGRFVHVAGATHFAEGEELILFTRTSDAGYYFVTGLFQGAQPIVRDKAGGGAEVLTGAPVAGSLVEVEAGGKAHQRRAVGAAELPARMALEDYKTYLRSLVGE